MERAQVELGWGDFVVDDVVEDEPLDEESPEVDDPDEEEVDEEESPEALVEESPAAGELAVSEVDCFPRLSLR